MHATTAGIYYQDQCMQQLNCPVKALKIAAGPTSRQSPGGLLVASDVNGNSPATFYAPSAVAQQWTAIGDDASDGKESRYFFASASNASVGGGATAAAPALTSATIAAPPRWMSCFPPPSLLPWWCVSSDQNADNFTLMSNDESDSSNTPTPSNPDLLTLNNYVSRISPDLATRSSDGQANQTHPQGYPSPRSAPVLQSPSLAKPSSDVHVPIQKAESATNGSENSANRLRPAAPTFVVGNVDSTNFDLKQTLQNQLEYYFSRENLAVDTYLKSQMDGDQYVPIKIVANFNKVRKLTSDFELIVAALRDSTQVQVDENGEKVRPLFKRSTLVLRDMPSDTDEIDIQGIFSSEKCPKIVSCEYAHNNSWYVNFESDEDAQKAFIHLRQIGTFKGKPILARIKNAPIPRQSQRHNSSAGGGGAPMSVDAKLAVGGADVYHSMAPSSTAIGGADGNIDDGVVAAGGLSSSTSTTSSNSAAAAPPMDPHGAACIAPPALSSSSPHMTPAFALASAMAPFLTTTAAATTQRAVGGGQQQQFLYYATVAPPQTTLRLPPPSAATLAPYYGVPSAAAAPGLTMPYMDINQILTLNGLQMQNFLRPGVQLFMPTLTSNPGAFFDRRNKRSSSAGPPFHNKFYQTAAAVRPPPLMTSGFRPPFLINNMSNCFAPNAFAVGADMRRMPLASAVNGGNRPHNSHLQQQSAWSDGTNQRSVAAPNSLHTTARHFVNSNRSSSNNGFGSNGHRSNAASVNNSSANSTVSGSNGRPYSGRSSLSNSDYWSCQKDFANSPSKYRPKVNRVQQGSFAMPRHNQSHVSTDDPAHVIAHHDHSTDFDLQSSSFPPLSETNTPQSLGKMSYAEKAKTAVGRNNGGGVAKVSVDLPSSSTACAPATATDVVSASDATSTCNTSTTGFAKDNNSRKPARSNGRRERSYYNRNAQNGSSSNADYSTSPKQQSVMSS